MNPPDRPVQQVKAPRVVFVRQGEDEGDTLAELRSSETTIVVTLIRPGDVPRAGEAVH